MEVNRPGVRRLLAAALLVTATSAVPASPAAGFTLGEVGFEEHLGAAVPLSTRLLDEQGAAVALADLVHVPTLLALVYYRCPNACDYLLTGIAQTLAGLDARPGADYQVLTVSFDPREGPADARKAKQLALESIQKPYPAMAWRFLTGDADSVRGLADAVGFRYHANGKEFDHPLGLVVLSPQGKIVRYMTGTDFLPVDIRMSLLEASQGRVGPTIARVLRFCFSYDPQRHAFVFNTLKVSAVVVIALVGGFGLYLVLSGRRRRGAAGG